MTKRTILFLELGAIAAGIIGGILFSVAVAGSVAAASADTTGTATVSATGGALGIVAFILFAVAGILGLIAWIGALIKTAQLARWGWFVVVLIFSGLGTLIYAIAGPDTRAVPAMQ